MAWRLSGRRAILDRLRDAVANFEVEEVKAACLDALAAGIPVEEVILEGMARGLDVVGGLYEKDEYLLPELIMAAEAMSEGVDILRPHIKKSGLQGRGVVILGSVRGDVHDIGKNLVGDFLTASGFEVHDLGIDVSPREFADEVERKGADIVGMSTLMTTTRPAVEETIRQLEVKGTRSRVKVMVGGGSISQEYAERVKADGYGEDAVAAVRVAEKLLDRQE